jgi:hypothetical protein
MAMVVDKPKGTAMIANDLDNVSIFAMFVRLSRGIRDIQAQYAQHAEVPGQLAGITHLREGRIGHHVDGAFASHLAD